MGAGATMRITCLSKPYRQQAFELSFEEGRIVVRSDSEVLVEEPLASFVRDFLLFPSFSESRKYPQIKIGGRFLNFAIEKKDLKELENARDEMEIRADPKAAKRRLRLGIRVTVASSILVGAGILGCCIGAEHAVGLILIGLSFLFKGIADIKRGKKLLQKVREQG